MKPVELFLLTPGAGPWQACQEEKPEVRKASLDALVECEGISHYSRNFGLSGSKNLS